MKRVILLLVVHLLLTVVVITLQFSIFLSDWVDTWGSPHLVMIPYTLWLLGPIGIFLVDISVEAVCWYFIESALCLSFLVAALVSKKYRLAFAITGVAFWVITGLIPYALMA